MIRNSSCPADNYFGSAEFLANCSHFLSIFTIPVNILGIYFVIYKTPTFMARLKWVILNAHLWGLINDTTIGFLVIPYIFFPVTAGLTLGVLSYFKISDWIQAYFSIVQLAEVCASVVYMFENRHNSLVIPKYRMTRKLTRTVFYIMNSLIPVIATSAMFWNVPPQTDDVRSRSFMNVPCPPNEYFQYQVNVLMESPVIVGSTLFIAGIGYSTQGLTFALQSFYFLSITVKNPAISKKTKSMQRSFFTAVCAQIIAPSFIFILPVSYATFSLATSYFNQAFNNLIFLTVSLHGFTSTLVTICVYDVYKYALLNIFGKNTRNTKISPMIIMFNI